MKGLLLIVLLMTSLLVQGQQDWGLGLNTKGGFLWVHRGVMGHLPQEHAFSAELSYFIQSKGKKEWHELYKYPSYGLTFIGSSPGNRDVLGTFWGTYLFIDFPLIKKSVYEMDIKVGSGLAYGTKKFNYFSDPKNVAIGSNWNSVIVLGWSHKFKFYNNVISLGLDMTHYSNAAMTVPNLGLNIPFVSLGYSRTIRTSTDPESIPSLMERKRWYFGLTGVISSKETYPTGGARRAVFGLNGFTRVFLKPKVGMEASIDFIANQAIMNYKPTESKGQRDIIQVGSFIGYILPLDKLHLITGMGVYLRDKYKPEGLMYHKVGLRYYLNENVNINCLLKSHWGSADYFESGISYTFNSRSK